MGYDSYNDTMEHKKKVSDKIYKIIKELQYRAEYHDDSKLQSPEKEIFDEFTGKLQNSTYGSDEYKENLKNMKSAIEHHYAVNQHHPEHNINGIDGMSLIDIIEMFCDWVAATERHIDDDIKKSLSINKDRFNMSDQLYNIFSNTINKI